MHCLDCPKNNGLKKTNLCRGHGVMMISYDVRPNKKCCGQLSISADPEQEAHLIKIKNNRRESVNADDKNCCLCCIIMICMMTLLIVEWSKNH